MQATVAPALNGNPKRSTPGRRLGERGVSHLSPIDMKGELGTGSVILNESPFTLGPSPPALVRIQENSWPCDRNVLTLQTSTGDNVTNCKIKNCNAS